MAVDVTHANRSQRASLPPGPRIAPLQSFRYFRDPVGYCDEMKARYGDLFTMPTMNGTLIIRKPARVEIDSLTLAMPSETSSVGPIGAAA